MRNVTITESTGGLCFWSEGDNVYELNVRGVTDEVAYMLVNREKFTITFE